MCKVLKEIWKDYISSNNYAFGKDFISTETENYFAICPFDKEIMIGLNRKLYEITNEKFHLRHCLCIHRGAFSMWYGLLYREGRLKVFFFKKDFDFELNKDNSIEEFTCWIDRDDRKPHFIHDIFNRLINGTYKKGYNDSVYDLECILGRENDFSEVSKVTTLVIDELFNIYEDYKIELEKTLINTMGQCGINDFTIKR